jgi:thiamine pyrophosphokinase
MERVHALLIVNGVLPGEDVLSACVARARVVLCADGGADRAAARGITPDIVIGDLDSVSPGTLLAWPSVRVVRRDDQSSTDMEKALELAAAEGARHVCVVGIGGHRLDHQLVGLNVLEKYGARVEIEIRDDHGVGVFLAAPGGPARRVFRASEGRTLSLIAFRRAEGIVTEGLRFPLRGETLEWGVRDGLSNEIVSAEAVVTLSAGMLFAYQVLPGRESPAATPFAGDPGA